MQTVLQEFVKEYFKYSPNFIDYKIEPLIKLLRDDLNFYIEYPYVDKVFRDTEFEFNDELFFGYISIRPTLPNLIGRTMLSPRAYKLNGFLCCLVSSNVVINGKKLNIDAFPHSSQDGETIPCAETTIWSVMEYFGIKYPEYKPVLPSKILNALVNNLKGEWSQWQS